MSTLVKTIIQVLYIVICIAIVVVVLMQEGKTSGLGAVSGAYWSKNKGRSAEGKLVKITSVLGALFIILSIVLCMNMK